MARRGGNLKQQQKQTRKNKTISFTIGYIGKNQTQKKTKQNKSGIDSIENEIQTFSMYGTC